MAVVVLGAGLAGEGRGLLFAAAAVGLVSALVVGLDLAKSIRGSALPDEGPGPVDGETGPSPVDGETEAGSEEREEETAQPEGPAT